MRYEARVTAYDMLDQVCVVLSVQATDGLGHLGPHQVLSTTLTVRGQGETDVREWLRDALVAAIETL